MTTTSARKSVPLLSQSKLLPRGLLIAWLIVAALDVILICNHGYLDRLIFLNVRWAMGNQEKYQWEGEADLKRVAGENDPLIHEIFPAQPPPFHAKLFQRTERFWLVLKSYGEFATPVILAFGLWLLHQRRGWAALVFAVACTAAGLLGDLVRTVTGRFRPEGLSVTSIWEGGRGFYDHHNLSFPSGHATLVFAMAAVLTYYVPKGRWLFLAVAAGTAVSRVVMLAHFPSDVLSGSIFGYTVAWMIAVSFDPKLPPEKLGRNQPAAELPGV